MILVDTNLLVYAHVAGFEQHERARSWLDGRLAGVAGVAMPWQALLGFVRIVTNRRIFERPLAVDAAWRQVHDWLLQERTWVPTPTEDHDRILSALLSTIGGRSDLVSDAHLAALAIAYGLTLNSADRDFSRFPGLRWENPLEA